MSLLYQLNSTDITGHVESGIRSSGGEHDVKTVTGPGDAASLVYDEGMDPLELKFTVFYRNDPTTARAFVKDAKTYPPTALYLGDSDWFYVPDIVTLKETPDDRIWMKRYQVTAYMARPEKYGTESLWEPTDEILPIAQTTGETNAGNIDAPLYSLALTARMSGPALQFDGTDDYVTAGAVDLSGDALSFEIVLWSPESNAGYPGIIEYGDDEDGGAGRVAIQYQFDPQDVAIIAGTAGPGFQYTTYTDLMDAGCWNRIIFTFDVTGNAVKVYKDGVQFGTTWTPTTALSSFVSETLDIFRRQYWTPDYFAGKAAAFRCWKRVLSAEEAAASAAGEAVSNTSLVIDWDFCEGQGATAYDLSGNDNDGTLMGFADLSAGAGDAGTSGWLTSIGPASPTLQLLTAADAVESQMTLTTGLMTSEVLSQDRFGRISQVYQDDFAANVGRRAFGYGHFRADGVAHSKYVGSEIVLTAPGALEVYSITITDTDQASTTVSVTGNAITVDLETDSGTPVATAQEVIDAINADDDVIALGVVASLASGEDGTTVMSVLSQNYFSLNVAVTGGSLVIEDNREAEYHLPGAWPIKAGGLVVTFTPTLSGSGTATFDVSVDDGDTWETVSSAAAWDDGEENEICVPQADGYTTIWIRFACGSDPTSLSITGLTISQERYVSDSLVPKIGIDDTRKVKLDGDGRGNLVTAYRGREYP